MKNSNLKQGILTKIEDLISQSCPQQKVSPNYERLHIAIIKKYYNATDVSIDYHRRRVEMNIVMDENYYDPKTVNLYLPTLHTNLWFRNLCDFLKSCIDSENENLSFYASLLSSYQNSDKMLHVA